MSTVFHQQILQLFASLLCLQKVASNHCSISKGHIQIAEIQEICKSQVVSLVVQDKNLCFPLVHCNHTYSRQNMKYKLLQNDKMGIKHLDSIKESWFAVWTEEHRQGCIYNGSSVKTGLDKMFSIAK